MSWKYLYQKYIIKLLLRVKMIMKEFFEKWRHYSIKYAIYSSAWWIGWYFPPLRKLCMWGFINKSEYIIIYLRKKYGNIIDRYANNDYLPIKLSKDTIYPIWVFWYQGFEKAPELVKACYENLLLKNKGAVKPIEASNIEDYITIPEYIKLKREAGIISLAQYSDIVRVSLLAKYGGIWLDATCWCSQSIPPWVKELSFYSCKSEGIETLPMWSNSKWTGWGQGTNELNFPLYSFVRDMFYAYWENETYLIDYLLIDCLMYLAYDNIPIVKLAIDKLPANNEKRNNLWFLLNKAYEKNEFTKITAQTWLFKLSFKHAFLMTENSKPTFYNYLINQKL